MTGNSLSDATNLAELTSQEKQQQQQQTATAQMRFPYLASGIVVKGFGRGSKELGVPTANYPDEVVDQLPAYFTEGVYYGWAQVAQGPVYKMVMSVGKNPYYNNLKRTMETYVMHEFDKDFYGSQLKIAITGYLRPMANYKSLDELIAAIHLDIKNAKEALDSAENQTFAASDYFKPEIKNKL